MPTSDSKPPQEAAKLYLRTVISDAYTFVLSQELTEGIAAMNLESMMQQELARLQGPTTSQIYLPVLDRLRALKTSVEQAVEQVKSMPPEAFKLRISKTGTNEDQG